jgi:hypothetical protein
MQNIIIIMLLSRKEYILVRNKARMVQNVMTEQGAPLTKLIRHPPLNIRHCFIKIFVAIYRKINNISSYANSPEAPDLRKEEQYEAKNQPDFPGA